MTNGGGLDIREFWAWDEVTLSTDVNDDDSDVLHISREVTGVVTVLLLNATLEADLADMLTDVCDSDVAVS